MDNFHGSVHKLTIPDEEPGSPCVPVAPCVPELLLPLVICCPYSVNQKDAFIVGIRLVLIVFCHTSLLEFTSPTSAEPCNPKVASELLAVQ